MMKQWVASMRDYLTATYLVLSTFAWASTALGSTSLAEQASLAVGTSSAEAYEDLRISPKFDQWLLKAKNVSHKALVSQFQKAIGVEGSLYQERVEQICRQVKEMEQPESPRARGRLLQEVLFKANGYRSDSDLTNLQNLIPSKVTENRTGYCLGLTLLLLDICDRLGWKASAVSVPRHTFLRLEGEQPVNLETTLSGELKNDQWYQDKYAVGKHKASLRTLTPKELGGHILSNVAYAILEQGELSSSRDLIVRALALDPIVAEARANLGVCDAREGNYEKALSSFDTTLKLWPGDLATRLNRVSVLIPLERREEAIQELVALLRQYPAVTSLYLRAKEIRDQLDSREHWHDRQRLTQALIARDSEQRGIFSGLKAVYHRGMSLNDPVLRRVDKDLSFSWSWKSPGGKVPRDRFSVQWRGWIDVPATDRYTFFVICSDGVRMWIDGRPIIDAWVRSNNNVVDAKIDLLAGKHEIQINFFESVGEAGILLLLTSEQEELTLDLDNRLFHPGPDVSRLKGKK